LRASTSSNWQSSTKDDICTISIKQIEYTCYILRRGNGSFASMVTTLLNRYYLEAELGKGGMGTVYRAHDTLLDRDVAIKVLTDPSLGATGRARLLSEARAVARLNHPNIIAIYDVAETGDGRTGEESAAGDGILSAEGMPFIVMELAQGETLDQRTPESLAEILAIARQICAALDHAHGHGILHGDLKPENVVITPDGTAKLMDFGLARPMDSGDREPLLTGTVLYLAPEQARGQAVDARADLYALGVVLYEALTGRLPFTGDDPLSVIAQHLSAQPVPPRELRPDLPPALEAIILRLLAKNPDERFASAREVKDALAAIPTDGRQLTASFHNLPAEVTSFIGREKEIGEVRRLLAGTRLLTLTGSGGTGKTRLALRAAVDVQGDFPDGVWLVDMAPLSDPDLVAQSVASALGIRDKPGEPLTRRITDALHYKNLLLILDNCEHLIGAVANLAESMLQVCPDIKLLVTSREVIGISGERAYRVPSLSLPPVGVQAPLLADLAIQYEAVRLFVDRAATIRSDFALTDANTAAVVQICQQLDGVPLALELAAARVRTLGVEQIAARLDDRFRLLTGGSRTALPRQQTLRALIDWSWDLLSAEEKLLFRRLSVFVSGWTLEAAEFVVAGPDASQPSSQSQTSPLDVLELLTRLVDKSLVVVEEHDGVIRYRMLETIRQYGREKLVEAGEAEVKDLRGRQLAFFLKLAESAEPALRGSDQVTWLARLELEHDNLRAGLNWVGVAVGSGYASETALRLAGALARFWYLHGYWSEGRAWLRQALLAEPLPEMASEGWRRARARALAALGWLMDENGEDLPLYEESLALYRGLGDRAGMAYALRGLGAGLLNRGEHEQSLVRLNEALDLYRGLSDPWGIAITQYNRGWLAVYQDNAARAAAIWEESLAAFRQTGDRWGIAVTLGALSYIARQRGDYARAVALSEESLGYFREVGDNAGIATSLNRLGIIAFRRGDYRQAVSLIEEGIPLKRELGEQLGLSDDFALLGLIAGYQGEYDRATAWLEQSLALAREAGDPFTVALNTGYLAQTTYYAGNVDRAADLWQESLNQQRDNNDRLGMGHALNGLGLVAWRRGNLDTARAQIEESLRLFKEVGDKRYIAFAYKDLGQLAHARGDGTEARRLSRKALRLFRELGDRQGQAESLVALAASLGTTLQASRQAARLLGAAEALRTVLGVPVPAIERAGYERDCEVARQATGADAFDAAWREGQALPLDQIMAEALSIKE
jgi:non-specific serine/threonine protein kinase